MTSVTVRPPRIAYCTSSDVILYSTCYFLMEETDEERTSNRLGGYLGQETARSLQKLVWEALFIAAFESIETCGHECSLMYSM